MNVKIVKLNLCVFDKTSEIVKISSCERIDSYSIEFKKCILAYAYNSLQFLTLGPFCEFNM